ncbi:MAG TPA: hypothetical protein VNS09_06060 [Solirubrobacter sp.]|nr:hypothetical protein [Solirubrobacter sp.]
MRALVGASVAAALAVAAPADLTLRIEGRSTTLYEGSLRTSAAPVDGSDGTGAHDCGAGASPASALAASGQTWSGTWNPDFLDFFLQRVGPDANDPQATSYWSILVNWRYGAGICRARVAPGGEVLLAYGPGARVLRLDGPAHAGVGEPFTVSVRDGWIRATTGADGGPVAGAAVGGATTGPDGRATLRFDTPGLQRLKATAPDAIRSNALDVCVGDASCEGAPPPLQQVVEAPSGTLTVDVPAAGERYAPGGSPLRLLGRASGPVSVALSGRDGTRCVGLLASGKLGRRACGATVRPVAARRDDGWALTLRRRLVPGAYELVAASGGRTVTRRFQVAATPSGKATAAAAATRWLRGAQTRDHRTAGSAPSARSTDWAAIALARAAPASAATTRVLARVRATRRGDLAARQRGALALASSRAQPDRRRRRQLQAAIARVQRADGSWRGGRDATAYAVLALRGSRHRAALRSGRAWLRAQPLPGDAERLGVLLWALGRDAPPDAVTRLRALQGADGGFGAPANAQATALAVIGLEAAGVRARSVRGETGISGLDYLRARAARSGRVAYDRRTARTPTLVTAAALLAFVSSR